MTYGITTCNKAVIIVCHMHILTDEGGRHNGWHGNTINNNMG